MAPLSWRHHTLLQALLSRGPLTERDFHALFTAISGGKNPENWDCSLNDQLSWSQLVKWQPRPSEYIKINTDGAYAQNSGSGGWGCVARGADGVILFSAAGAIDHVSDALHAETEALVQSILLADRLGFGHVVWETDCSSLKQAVLSNDLDLSHLGHLFRGIKHRLVTGFPDFKILYCPREYNKVAHVLASLGAGRVYGDYMCWQRDFPEVVQRQVAKDLATHRQVYNDTLLRINKDLAYLQFELRACINQYDGTVYYGVVNNIADEESKLGSKFSVPQIAFYKGLLEAIVHEAGNDGSITSIDALHVRIEGQVVVADGSQDGQSRLPSSITSFSYSQKEKTLNELIKDRWLSYTATGKIGLGIRSFLDLRSWFRSNDIQSCEVCNEAGIKASTCPNEGCNVRIHSYCLKKKFSKRKASRDCPGCGTEWPRQEGEEDGDDDANEPEETQQAPPAERSSSRKKRKSVKAELVEEAEDVGPSTVMPRRSTRTAKAEAVMAADEASSAGASQPARSSKRRKK